MEIMPFEYASGQIKDYKIGISCFSGKHAALRRKNKDWFSRKQDKLHVYPQTVVSVSYNFKNSIKCVGLVHSTHHYHSIESNLFSP